MPGRSYTMKDVLAAERMRLLGYSLREIAQAQGRTSHSQAGVHLSRRLPSRPHPCADRLPGLADRIRTLLESGLPARQTERALKLPDATAARYLARMGLSAPPDGRLGNTFAEDVQNAGTVAASDRRREQCVRLGWPETSSPCFARILSVLGRGALTRREIFDRLGWSSDRSGELGRHLRRMLEGGSARGKRKTGYPLLEVRVTGRGRSRRVRYAVGAWLLARRDLA